MTTSRILDWVSRPTAFREFVVALAVGFLWLGVGGRLVMTAIQWAAAAPSEWSWGGSAGVIILGAAMGPPGAAAYAAFEPSLPGNRWVKGMLFGGVFCGFWTAVYFFRPAGPIELRAAPYLASVLFGILLVGFGVVVAALSKHRTPQAPVLTRRRWPGLAVAAMTIFCLGLALYALISR